MNNKCYENEAKSVVVSEEIIEESAETIAVNQIESEELMSATAKKFDHLGLTFEETIFLRILRVVRVMTVF